MLERHICLRVSFTLKTAAGTNLRCLEPLVLILQPVHRDVKVVQVTVSQELVIDEIELTSSVGKRVAVTLSREVHPSECKQQSDLR